MIKIINDFLLLSLLFMASACQAQLKPTGEWLPIQTSKGGMGTSRTFHEDGKLELVLGPVLKSNYRVHAKTLILESEQLKEPLEFSFELTDQKLKLINKKTQKEKVLSKVKSQVSNGLIGKWSGKGDYGGSEVYTFTNDHVCFIQMMMKSQSGRFLVKRDELIETISGKQYVWKYKLDGERLTLVSEDGSEKREYLRGQMEVGNERRMVAPFILKEMMKSRTPDAKYKRAMIKLKEAKTVDQRYTVLEDVAKLSYVLGKYDDAKAYSEELMGLHNMMKDHHWNYGKVHHSSHMVLGRLALREGRVYEAKRHLLDSIKPLVDLSIKQLSTMSSFGPNLSLVKDLLENGEWDISLEYFKIARTFWKNPKNERWMKEIEARQIPHFGANLVY